MFDRSSRYRDVPVATYVDARGRSRQWVTLRLPSEVAETVTHAVPPRERLDALAARAYGDPAVWWRIADANVTRLTGPPHELVAEPGESVEVPQPVRGEVLPS